MAINLDGKFLVQKKKNSKGETVFIMTGFLFNTPKKMDVISDEMWVTNLTINETGDGLRFTDWQHGDEHIPSPEDFLENGCSSLQWKNKQKLKF